MIADLEGYVDTMFIILCWDCLEDIVLVTLQYRLGPLGFLSTEDSTAPGSLSLPYAVT
jgi:hypothetical protein